MNRSALALLLVTVVGLPACENKVAQCNKMVDLLNQAATEMEKLQPNEDDLAQSAAETRKMSELAAKTVEQLEAIELRNETLKTHAAAYKEVLENMGSGTAEMAGYMDRMAALEKESAAEANAKLDSTRSGIEAVCITSPAGCQKVGDAMAKVPDNSSDDQLATALEAYAAELEALELPEDKQKVVADHVAAVKSFVALLEEAEALQKKADEAQAKLDAVIEREEKLVAEINTFCVGTPTPE